MHKLIYLIDLNDDNGFMTKIFLEKNKTKNQLSLKYNIFFSFFAEENYDAFCLAYMFTYRDFEGGTLGLAWTGDMKNAGGVCERNGVSFIHPVLN